MKNATSNNQTLIAEYNFIYCLVTHIHIYMPLLLMERRILNFVRFIYIKEYALNKKYIASFTDIEYHGI